MVRQGPVLSHNLTMAVTPGIPPAGNLSAKVQDSRRSRGHKSCHVSGYAAEPHP